MRSLDCGRSQIRAEYLRYGNIKWIFDELSKYLSNDKYGFNEDLVITLVQASMNLDASLKFRTSSCTLLHAILHCNNSISKTKMI